MEIDDFLKNVVGEQQSVLPRGFNVSTIPCVPETSQDNMPHGASVNQSTFMPEFIYKYCKKTDFDKYYSKGIFQLGSLKKI